MEKPNKTNKVTKKTTSKKKEKTQPDKSEQLRDEENLLALYEEAQEDDSLMNNYLLEKEKLNGETIPNNSFLYPSLDDPNFNIKIAEKKEFHDSQYDGKIYDIEKQARILCNSEFELSPHQLFVRNFLSFQTPYNSLLLYHGLGTGKTCSAISVSEEMRDYLKQIGLNNRIIVVASPNVQENFKLQLFDERKLKLVDGLWNIRSCTGNKYLKEINPMNMKGLTKQKVILQVKRIINNAYLFLGYIEFAHLIERKSEMKDEISEKNKKSIIKKKLQQFFNNRLIIIDEIHNIRVSDDNNKDNKLVAHELLKLVSNVNNLRLLLLSATPMFNSYKEIIWLINLMNINDKRGTIDIKDVFNSNGNFLIKDGNNVGEELLRRKATGYVSYVRGENPYTFPYRIFPFIFDAEHSSKNMEYPQIQFNGKSILQKLEHVDVFINKIGSYQSTIYNKIIASIQGDLEKDETEQEERIFKNIDTTGYSLLQKPLQALNIVYPNDDQNDIKNMLGKPGLDNIMGYVEKKNPPSKSKFYYKNKKFGSIFSPDYIANYSSKIKNITTNVVNSDGIILIYSYYIDSGLVPIALALEELGFTRYGSRASSLFKDAPHEPVDYQTFEVKSKHDGTFFPAKYCMITGDKGYSPNNLEDVKALTDESNKDGKDIKVVLISKSGAEGLDFKNIRQVHILEPWYNMNLIEQIIGRAVRNCSHKQLDFKYRNVEIFLYGTLLDDTNQEAVDLYIYRIAEGKAMQMGRVSRVLKENAVDCILNHEQGNFSEAKMQMDVVQVLSNRKKIDFPIGDKPYSATCDYMETCEFTCKPTMNISKSKGKLDTYSEAFINFNRDKIILRIYDLFKESYFYKKDNLIASINMVKVYPLTQIYSALSYLINNENEFIFDGYDRIGRLINIGDYYLFQPVELNNNYISMYDRSHPVDVKRNAININLDNLSINKEIKDLRSNYDIKFIQEKFFDGKEVDIEIESKRETDDIVFEDLNVDTPNEKQETKKMKNIAKMDVNNLIKELEDNYKLGTSKTYVSRGEENWYIYCSKIIQILHEQNKIDMNILEDFLISHILEMLNYSQTIDLINHLFFELNLSSFEIRLKNYYTKSLIQNKNLEALVLNKDGKIQVVIKKEENWEPAESEDLEDLKFDIHKLKIDKDELAMFVGFMSYFTSELYVFKVKNMSDKRSKGARCDQSGKANTLNLLNKIIDEEGKYTIANTKGRHQTEFCVLQEFLLRLFNNSKKDGKIWFLSPEQGILSQIEKISFA